MSKRRCLSSGAILSPTCAENPGCLQASSLATSSSEDVAAAAQRLRGIAHRTPVHTSATVDERTGARVFFKCENLQRMGAFKFRGAYNAFACLSAEQRARGVLTYSSGTTGRRCPWPAASSARP